MTAPHEKTQAELQQLIQEQRDNCGHVINLLSVAEKNAIDGSESLIAAALHYASATYRKYDRLDELAAAHAKKGGA